MKRIALLAVLCAAASSSHGGASDSEMVKTVPGEKVDWRNLETATFHSDYLRADILWRQGVFPPVEAEEVMLPFMKKHADLFAGRTVLDIGAGTGMIGLYAAKLGAKRVVATDISKLAIQVATENAERIGVASVYEARYVPPDDISAYAVIKPDERFDIIISNPPYTLSLEALDNTSVIDKGDLGFSIVHGLGAHLTPDGVAMLFYPTFFYHGLMVKYARHLGHRVQDHPPRRLTHMEARILFGSYTDRLCEGKDIDPEVLSFSRDELPDHFRCESDAEFPGFILISKMNGSQGRP